MRLLPLWLLIAGLALVCAGSDSDSDSDESKEKHRLKKKGRHHHNRHNHHGHDDHHNHEKHEHHGNHPAYPQPYGLTGRYAPHEVGHNSFRMNSPPSYFPIPPTPIQPTYMYYPPYDHQRQTISPPFPTIQHVPGFHEFPNHETYRLRHHIPPAYSWRPEASNAPIGLPLPSSSSSSSATSVVNQQPGAADPTPAQPSSPSEIYRLGHYPLPGYSWTPEASNAPIGFPLLPSSSSSSSATSVVNQQHGVADPTPVQASSPSASATSNSAVTINQNADSVATEAPQPAESHNPEQEHQPMKEINPGEHVQALSEADSRAPSKEPPVCSENEICNKYK